MSKTKPKQGTTPEDLPHTAVKFDSGKVRTHLFPVRAYLEISQVFDYGALKYDEGNWKRGESFHYSRLISAADRHLKAFQLGQDLDTDTQKSHLAHMGCCIAMLLELYCTRRGIDDRGKSQIIQGNVGLADTYMVNDYNPPPPKPEEPICMKVSLTPRGSGNGKPRGNRSRTGKRRPK